MLNSFMCLIKESQGIQITYDCGQQNYILPSHPLSSIIPWTSPLRREMWNTTFLQWHMDPGPNSLCLFALWPSENLAITAAINNPLCELEASIRAYRNQVIRESNCLFFPGYWEQTIIHIETVQKFINHLIRELSYCLHFLNAKLAQLGDEVASKRSTP